VDGYVARPIFIDNALDDFSRMGFDVDNIKPYVILAWFDFISYAPFASCYKANECDVSNIWGGVQTKLKVFT
jgi:hypothetical protein